MWVFWAIYKKQSVIGLLDIVSSEQPEALCFSANRSHGKMAAIQKIHDARKEAMDVRFR